MNRFIIATILVGSIILGYGAIPPGKARLNKLSNEYITTNALQEIESSSLVTNSLHKLFYYSGSNLVAKTLLTREALVANTDYDLISCKNELITLDRVFRSWGKFDIDTDTSSTRKANWIWNSSTICETVNTTGLAGYYSPNKYNEYDITVRLFSTSNDNDTIGLLAACAMDDQGNWHTLTFIRALGDQGTYWSCILDLNNFSHTSTLNGQVLLVDGSSTTTNIKTGWNDGRVSDGTLVRIIRSGNKFTGYCSQFNNTEIDLNTKIEVDLDQLNYNTVNLFKGSSPIGFVCFSQPYSMYELIDGFDINEYIIDATQTPNKILTIQDNDWIELDEDPITKIGGSRFCYNRVTSKLFYCDGKQFINISSLQDLGDLLERTKGVNVPIKYNNGSRYDVRVELGEGAMADVLSGTYYQGVAIGQGSHAAEAGIALGPNSENDGRLSISMGWRSEVAGNYSIGIGPGVKSHEDYWTDSTRTVVNTNADYAEVTGNKAVGIGYHYKIYADRSVGLGDNVIINKDEPNTLKFNDTYIVRNGELENSMDPVNIEVDDDNIIMAKSSRLNNLDISNGSGTGYLDYTRTRNYEIYIDNNAENRRSLPVKFKFDEKYIKSVFADFDTNSMIRTLPVFIKIQSPVTNKVIITKLDYDEGYNWNPVVTEIDWSNEINISGTNLQSFVKYDLFENNQLVRTEELNEPFTDTYSLNYSHLTINYSINTNNTYGVHLYDVNGTIIDYTK